MNDRHKRAVPILLVEDDEDDYALTRDLLSGADGGTFHLEWVTTYDAALEAIRRNQYEAYLVDYRLGEHSGLELLREAAENGCTAPMIMLTGQGTLQVDVQAMNAGAADYLVKDQLSTALLERSIRYAMERKAAERALRESGERYRNLFHGVPVGLWRTTPDGQILDANPALVRMLGYPGREALLRVNAADLYVDPEDLRWWQLLLEHEWVIRDFEAQWRTHEGSIIWAQISLRAVRDGKGRVRYYEAAALDITERKWAERAVRRSEEHFRALIENAHDVITVLDTRGVIRYESPSVERVLGYKPEELIGKSTFELVHPDDGLPVTKAFFRGIQGSGVPLSTEFRVRHKDGSWRTFEGIAKNLCEDPIVAGLVINSRDITERKQAEAEVERQREALSQREKLAAMGTLLAGVAHELNNPLTVVKSQAALLHGQAGNGRMAARTEKIAQAADRCARIVKNFLALAREHPPERRPVGLNQVVREAVELLAYQLRVDNVEVTLDLAEDLSSLWADPHQLHQVVLNLVSNAHQAMRQAAPPRRLTLTTRSDAARARVRLEVADTGPGIPPEIQARIFEPFFTTKPQGQGTGLGLSLCQRIVEAHGGSISAESQPGQGARLRIELTVEAPPATEFEVQVAETRPSQEGRAILVVDDEPDVAEVLVDLLTADGHQVDTAANGLLALEKLRERTYDLVLSDFRMPELDGAALYRELHCRCPSPFPGFMLFTGVTHSPEIREFVEKTRVPTVSKPFDLEEVRRAVQALLEAMD